MANSEIRTAIIEKGLKHYQVAAACNVTAYTFSRWLQIELPQSKKEMILEVIRNYEL